MKRKELPSFDIRYIFRFGLDATRDTTSHIDFNRICGLCQPKRLEMSVFAFGVRTIAESAQGAESLLKRNRPAK